MSDAPTKDELRGFLLDGRGGGTPLTWAALRSWSPGGGELWAHLNPRDPRAREWLLEHSGLDEVTCRSLFADETRPRVLANQDGVLVILRGVNLNPGADPEDMVSLRLWLDGGRMISLSRRGLLAVGDLVTSLEQGSGPACAAELHTTLAGHLLDRMGPVLLELGDRADAFEERSITDAPGQLQGELAEHRRQLVALRRHLAPQRDAMARLAEATTPWFGDDDSPALHALADRITRHVEELEALRDRAAVSQDLLASRQSDSMNRRMMVLSLVAAVFLPLGFLTGLLGINVGGMPGVESGAAFGIVCALLVVLGLFEVWILKRMGWWEDL